MNGWQRRKKIVPGGLVFIAGMGLMTTAADISSVERAIRLTLVLIGVVLAFTGLTWWARAAARLPRRPKS